MRKKEEHGVSEGGRRVELAAKGSSITADKRQRIMICLGVKDGVSLSGVRKMERSTRKTRKKGWN